MYTLCQYFEGPSGPPICLNALVYLLKQRVLPAHRTVPTEEWNLCEVLTAAGTLRVPSTHTLIKCLK